MFRRGLEKIQKYAKKKIISRLERRGGLERFHTFIHLEVCIGRICSASDVRAFYATVTIRCKESEQANSRFHYYAHRRIYSVCFVYEEDNKILFYYILFSKLFCI